MRRIVLFLIACVAAIAMQAQIIKCHIDGPANVRQQANTKSAVVGSIKNGMVAEVSQYQGNMYKIHSVYNPYGGSAYTGKVVGYYTHRQNLIFDMSNSSNNSSYSQSHQQSNTSTGSNAARDQLALQDLALLDEIEEIDKEIEKSKQRTTRAFSDLNSALRQYGKTMPTAQYWSAFTQSVNETKELCFKARQRVNSLQTIDGTQLFNKYLRQEKACNELMDQTKRLVF